MNSKIYRLINGITLYRVLAAPVLLLLIFWEHWEAFRYLLILSFFTDAIDGFLARKYKVVSKYGSRLDSIGDDLTVFVALFGFIKARPAFVEQEWPTILLLVILFFVQTAMAFYRYRRMSNFHTYLAKLAAILQAFFLISAFFVAEPSYTLFYLVALITGIELLEEMILVALLKDWQTDVKGIYWVLKRNRRTPQ